MSKKKNARRKKWVSRAVSSSRKKKFMPFISYCESLFRNPDVAVHSWLGLKHHPDIKSVIESDECISFAQEWSWHRSGKPFIYVPKEVTDLVYGSRFDPEVFDYNQSIDPAVFIFETGVRYDELELTSCFFSVEKSKVMADSLCDAFDISYLRLRHDVLENSSEVSSRGVVDNWFCARDSGDTHVAYISNQIQTGPSKGVHFTTQWKPQSISSVMGQTFGPELFQGLDDNQLDQVMSQGDSHFNSAIDSAKLSIRIVTGLLVYLKAYPDALREGFPDSWNRGEDIGGSKSVELHPDLKRRFESAGGDRQTHFRQGHFRYLGDARFRRNKDGSVRVVYVNPCFVGGRAYHVEEIKEVEV